MFEGGLNDVWIKENKQTAFRLLPAYASNFFGQLWYIFIRNIYGNMYTGLLIQQ